MSLQDQISAARADFEVASQRSKRASKRFSTERPPGGDSAFPNGGAFLGRGKLVRLQAASIEAWDARCDALARLNTLLQCQTQQQDPR